MHASNADDNGASEMSAQGHERKNSALLSLGESGALGSHLSTIIRRPYLSIHQLTPSPQPSFSRSYPSGIPSRRSARRAVSLILQHLAASGTLACSAITLT